MPHNNRAEQQINDQDEELMRQYRKKMHSLCDTSDTTTFEWYQVASVITLIVAVIALTKTYLI